MLDRRRLFVGLGGLLATLVRARLLGKGRVDVDKCKGQCDPNATKCPGGTESLVYEPYPQKADPGGATNIVMGHFKKGLLEKANTGAEVTAFLKKEAALLKKCYVDTLKAKVEAGDFEPEMDPGHDAWITLNDHAYILGQLTATMVRKKGTPPQDEPISARSFLRAKSKFGEAISKARCQCFIEAGAYQLPHRAGSLHTVELDKDCCLC